MKNSIFGFTGILPVAAGFMLMPSLLFAQTEQQVKLIKKESNLKELDVLKRKISKNTLTTKQLVEKAKANKLPYSGEVNGRYYELRGFDKKGNPLYYITENAGAALGTSTNKLNSSAGIFNLDGENMKVHEWDGGLVKVSHQEFGGRAVQKDNATTLSAHATHVAGTMVASGVDEKAKGMAPKASLDAYDWNNDTTEMIQAAESGALVSNHSYGLIGGFIWGQFSGRQGWHWIGSDEDEEFRPYGKYGEIDRDWDLITLNAPFYLPVKAAGNPRGDGPEGNEKHFVRILNPTTGKLEWKESSKPRQKNGGVLGFDCVHGAVSKNILTVGAANKITGGYQKPTDVTMASFSAFGPVDDGRIKPDIAGVGVDVYSTNSTGDTNYTSMSGTSMASPNVTGSLLLLQEHYSKLNGGNFMKAATLKALAIGTANEAGEADGPDYKSGWGLLNTHKAAVAITTNNKYSLISEKTLTNKSTERISVVASGTEPLVITIAWADPAPKTLPDDELNSRTATLVNDLDIRVKYSNETFYPWKLDPAQPNNPATKGDNIVDNVEQIVIPNPVAGATYEIEVSHKGDLRRNKFVTENSATQVDLENATEQNYSLVVTGINNGGNKDLNLSKISLPSDITTYSTQTPVSFEITNQGTSEATGAKLQYKVINADSGAEIASGEELLENIAGGGKLSKIVNIDLSTPFVNFKIEGNVEFGEDEFSENNKNEAYAYSTLVDITERTSKHFYDFETPLKNNGWTAKDINGDGKTWQRYVNADLAYEGTAFGVNFPNATGTNDWFISNPMKIKGNVAYRLTFYVGKFQKLNENLDVYWAYSGTPIENGAKIASITNIGGYKRVSYEFTAPNDGVINIGFHNKAEADVKTYAVAIDNVDVRYAEGKPMVAFKANKTTPNTYEEVSLVGDAVTSDNLPILGYEWEIQPQTYRITEGSLTTKDIKVIFEQEGKYSVALKARNQEGEEILQKADYITAKNTAVASQFTASSTNIYEETSVSFTSTATGNPEPTNFKWTITPSEGVEFINATTETSKNPVVKFSKEGKYSVKLEASSEHSSAEESKADFINVKGTYNPVTNARGTYNEADNKINLQWEEPNLAPAYEEDFAVRTLPQGMKIFDANGDRRTWNIMGVFSKSKPYAIWNQSWYLTQLTVDDWLVTPKISSGAEFLKYAVAHRGTDKYDVYVVEAVDGQEPTLEQVKNGTKIYSFEGTEETPWSGANMFVDRVFDIKEHTSKDFHIAFHHRTQRTDKGADLILDDIVVGYGKAPKASAKKGNITQRSEESQKAEQLLNALREGNEIVSEKDIEKYLSAGNEGYTPIELGVVDVPRLTGYRVEKLDGTILKRSEKEDKTYEETAGSQTIYEYNIYALYSNGKASKPVYVKVDITNLSTSEVKNDGLKIYPNPSDGLFVIEAKSGISSLKAEVYDMSGKLIFKNEFKGNKADLNLTQYPKGIYILNLVDSNGEKHSAKLMIK